MADANVHEQVFQASVDVLVLDDAIIDASPMPPMAESLWGHMPQDLLEQVLLFLPPASQARFCTVSKRWRDVMTTVEFQSKSCSLALNSGRGSCTSLRLLGFPGGRGSLMPAQEQQQQQLITYPQPRVRTLEFPGLLLPRDCAAAGCPGAKLSAHGDLLVVSFFDEDSAHLRCWVLNCNLVKQTWWELPPLVIDSQTFSDYLWKVGVKEGSSSGRFQVFAIVAWASPGRLPSYCYFHTYCSVNREWRVRDRDAPDFPHSFVDLRVESSSFSKGGCVLWDHGGWCWRWEGNDINPLPDLLSGCFTLSEPDMDTVFVSQCEEGGAFLCGKGSLKLHMLATAQDSGKKRRGKKRSNMKMKREYWKCVVDSERLGYYPLYASPKIDIMRARIVGNKVVMVVCHRTNGDVSYDNRTYGYHMLVYHMEDDCCTRHSLPPQAQQIFGCTHSLLLTPTASQLGL